MKQNWQIKKLKDICEKGSSNVNMKDLTDLQGEYPIYGASGLIKNVNFYHQEKEYIGIIKDGSGIGRTMLLPPKSSVIGTLQYILPKEGNLIQFINYALQSLDLTKFKQGAAIPHIYFKDYGETEIVVPPLADQRRIVAILDAKFAQIDALKAAAQKNLDNAEQLWKAQLEKEFGNKEWKMMKLGEVAKIISGYAFKSKDFMQNGKYQVIRMGNIKQNQMRLNESPVYVNDVSKLVLDKSLLKINDLVITQTGTKGKRDYGFVARIYKDNLLLNQRCACVRFQNDNTYLPLFFLYFSYTNIYKNQFFANEGGTVGQGNVGLDALRLMNIPIPSLAEQTAIVSRLDALSTKISDLKAKYRRQIECCDELRQSLLRAAFEGEM